MGEGSPGCQKVSRGKSQVFSLNFSVKSFLVKRLLLKINKTLICCTDFPTLGFSKDNCVDVIGSCACISLLFSLCNYVITVLEFILMFAEGIS